MSIASKLKEYLEKEGIRYKQSLHEVAYTAQEVAGAQHVPGKEFIKSVIVKVDGKPVMCVLPAVHLIDFDKLKKVTNAKNIELMTEKEIAEIFPEFEVGAVPPFGHLYDMTTYADKLLEDDEEIVFNGGTHTDSVKISCQDFIEHEHPIIADFGRHI